MRLTDERLYRNRLKKLIQDNINDFVSYTLVWELQKGYKMFINQGYYGIEISLYEHGYYIDTYTIPVFVKDIDFMYDIVKLTIKKMIERF